MKYWTQSVGALRIFGKKIEEEEIIDLPVILPVRRAGNLSGQDVPGLAARVTICVLQAKGKIHLTHLSKSLFGPSLKSGFTSN